MVARSAAAQAQPAGGANEAAPAADPGAPSAASESPSAPDEDPRRHRRGRPERREVAPPPAAESGVVVRAGGLRDRTALEFNISLNTLGLVPRINSSDILSLAPGVSVSNDAGESHAQHIFLRGFSGEDGRDTALSLDGVPINDESNPEANGLADLYFIIPELVERIDVTSGVSDPRQGNFAVAGSIDYHLGLRDRGVMGRASYGMFGYRRLGAFWGPGTDTQNFVGFETVHSDGFGARRATDRASAMGQYVFPLGNGFSGRVFGSLFHSTFESPGLVREDDVNSGAIDFYGSYPAAANQGGYSTRAMAVGAIDYHGTRDRFEMRLWGQFRDYGLRENFEGFYEFPEEGDLLRHGYTGGNIGINGYYRYNLPVGGRMQELEVGWNVRHDRFHSVLQHIDSTNFEQAELTEEDSAADLRVTHLGAYADLVIRPFSWLTLRGGSRVDLFNYDVDATTYSEDTMQQTTGHYETWTARVSPKVTLDFSLGSGIALIASYGTGFRSPGAMDFVWSGTPAFTTAGNAEFGVRYALPRIRGSTVRLQAALAAFHTQVDHDEVFDPVSGVTVSIGTTQRVGGVAWVRVQPFSWLDINASVTYTYATTDTDVPSQMIRAGGQLPYLPALVSRIDAAADAPVGQFHGETVRLRGGLGASIRSEVPMIANGAGPATFVIDGSAGVRVGHVAFDLAVRNLLDTRWRNAQFEYASNFVPGATPSPVPVQHFTAGTPFSMYGTVSLYF